VEGSTTSAVLQSPWEKTARALHEHPPGLEALLLSTNIQVTNAAFKAVLTPPHYRPRRLTFLPRAWKNGAIPTGWENKPVTWVSIEARAPLPSGRQAPATRAEWQVRRARRGGSRLSWGNAWMQRLCPSLDPGRTRRGRKHRRASGGAVPYGELMEWSATFWQWPNEYVETTRAAAFCAAADTTSQGTLWTSRGLPQRHPQESY